MTSAKFITVTLLSLILWGCNIEEKIDEIIIDISGTVTDNGNPVQGALVLLIESAEIEEGLSLSNGSVTDDNGNYKILKVDPGEYYVVAVEDNNNNMQFDAAGDRIGFYGVNPTASDIVPDKITISDTDVEDIDIIDMYTLPQ